MHLRLLAASVLDAAADAHTFGFALRDTKAVDSAFASFFLCDWETLELRRVSAAVFMQLKFGGCAATASAWMADPFACRAAPLADGGCAVLEPGGGNLHLFRPDGSHATGFPLRYGGAAPCDLVAEGDALWLTIPERDALVRYSINQREINLRVGGSGTFSRPWGVTRGMDSLWVCCKGSGEAKAFSLSSLEVTETRTFPAVPEKLYHVYSRAFALLDDRSICAVG